MNTVKRISQGTIHVVSVDGGALHAATADMAHVDYPAVLYTGEYEFIPSGEQQTIPINGKIANRDITINPIPHNYGLVTWNGAFLTIS
jgi:hypothetical protein